MALWLSEWLYGWASNYGRLDGPVNRTRILFLGKSLHVLLYFQAARPSCLSRTRLGRTLWVDSVSARATARIIVLYLYDVTSVAMHVQWIIYIKCRHPRRTCQVQLLTVIFIRPTDLSGWEYIQLILLCIHVMSSGIVWGPTLRGFVKSLGVVRV